MKIKKGYWWLFAFNLLYMIAFGIYYLTRMNYEFVWYFAVLVLIALIIVFTLDKSNLDYLALWGLSIWGFLHMAGGGIRLVPGTTLYGTRLLEIVNRGGDFYILKMDQVIHFYGFAIAAIVIFQLIWPAFKKLKGKKMPIFIAWIGAMGLGALNEVIEFLALVTLSKTGVGDIYNTGLDLVFNMGGAFAGAVIAYYWMTRKK